MRFHHDNLFVHVSYLGNHGRPNGLLTGYPRYFKNWQRNWVVRTTATFELPHANTGNLKIMERHLKCASFIESLWVLKTSSVVAKVDVTTLGVDVHWTSNMIVSTPGQMSSRALFTRGSLFGLLFPFLSVTIFYLNFFTSNCTQSVILPSTIWKLVISYFLSQLCIGRIKNSFCVSSTLPVVTANKKCARFQIKQTFLKKKWGFSNLFWERKEERRRKEQERKSWREIEYGICPSKNSERFSPNFNWRYKITSQNGESVASAGNTNRTIFKENDPCGICGWHDWLSFMRRLGISGSSPTKT